MVKTLRKRLQVPLGCRILEMSCVFNSVESGLVLFTDKGSILDFSSKHMKPISSLTLAGGLTTADVSFSKEMAEASQKGRKADTSFTGRHPVVQKSHSMTNLSQITDVSIFIDSLGKHQLVFLEEGKLSVTSLD
jgi:hypothetical protein